MLIILFLAGVVMPLAVITIGVLQIVNAVRFRMRATLCKAEVLSVDEQLAADGPDTHPQRIKLYRPKLAITEPDGTRRTVDTGYYSSRFSAAPGSTLTVWFAPPTEVRLPGIFWVIPVVLIFFGLIFGIVGLGMFLARWE